MRVDIKSMLSEVIDRDLKRLGGDLALVKVQRQRVSRRDSQAILPDEKKLVLLLKQVTFENPIINMLYEHFQGLNFAQKQAKDQLVQKGINLRGEIKDL